LRRRIVATRLPEKETVADFSQGVPLATVQKLARYWATEYDWRKVEARLNAVPNVITTSSPKAATSPPGSSRSSSWKNFAPASSRCARSNFFPSSAAFATEVRSPHGICAS
jgi:hypothetical protein